MNNTELIHFKVDFTLFYFFNSFAYFIGKRYRF